MDLITYRRTHKLTQEALADRIGVSQPAYARYEAGQRVPRPAIMARIVQVTGGAVTEADMYRAHVARAAAAGGKEAA
ncbi:helix-turn-helix domain-containing protein [Tistrella mobilis]|nr:helix-turn-helix transcriptional regulator [Tistrella mobilis]